MKKVILTRGLPGSGKSTWAKQVLDNKPGSYKRINKDDLRAMLDNNKWSNDNEKFVLKVRNLLILEALSRGKHVIIDDTNLHPKHERAIKELVKGDALVEIQDFTHVPLKTCIERDLQRPNSVGQKVIIEQYNRYLKGEIEEKKKASFVKQNEKLQKAIICDLDGTLALFDRNPFNAQNCHEDDVNIPVANIVETFYKKGYKIMFFSGRKDEYKKPTKKFLTKAFEDRIDYELHMRKTSDNRKDSILKREMFDTIIQDKYFVEFILDDRNQVVDMWREIGLTCLQVNYGDF